MEILMLIFVLIFFSIGIYLSFQIVLHDYGMEHIGAILGIFFFSVYFGLGFGLAIRHGNNVQRDLTQSQCEPSFNVLKNTQNS